MEYYISSGEITSCNQGISINNRAFRYGDGLFETMYFTNGKIINIDKHHLRLNKGLQLLRINCKKLNSNYLLNKVKELLKANKIEGAARIRLQVFRKDGGFYRPENNDCDYIIEAFPLKNNHYMLNSKGLKIGIAKTIRKNINQFSQLKSTAKPEMVICAIEAQENAWDDAILLNDNGNIVESSSSNIFIYKNNVIYTPSIDDGLLNGIMRQTIIEICKKYEVIETHLTEFDILNADEFFLTNAIIGINWVSAFKSKRYFHKVSDNLLNELNKAI